MDGWISLSLSHHVVLVLQEDGELLEEGHCQHQHLLSVALQDLHQHADDVLVPHLELGARVLCQVQQQEQSHWTGHTERWINVYMGHTYYKVPVKKIVCLADTK